MSSQRAKRRAKRYIMAGRAIRVRDHHGNGIRPVDDAQVARTARIARALADRVDDHTGIGFR